MRVRSIVFCLSLLAVIPFLWDMGTCASAGQEALIKAGDPFPDIPLMAPENPKEAAYLGIPEGRRFLVKDVKADLVLVEIMNVYCASCWRQVPVYNELYTLIESNPETRGRIKMIGVAVGNKDWEVTYFRGKFEVPFPVFPDPEFVMHEAIGGSKTPFSIFVRQDPAGKESLVADTHLGVIGQKEELLAKMQSMMVADLAGIKERGKKVEAEVVQVKPILTEEELQAKIRTAFSREGEDVVQFEKLELEKSGPVYSGLVREADRSYRLFAKVISRPPPCDVCHDIHYIYVFDSSGTILQFIPLQLTKYGNRPFNEEDVAKVRDRIEGRPISKPFHFDPKVDAVTRATITSAVIFKTLNEGQELFEELKKKGVI